MSNSATHPLMEDGPMRARAAILAGDKEAALAAVDEILAEAVPIHDIMCDLTAVMLTFIGERLGEEAVEEAWRYAAEIFWRPFFESAKASGDVEAFVVDFIAQVRSHRYNFDITEDDEKWVVEIIRGTSGERMVLEGKVERNGGEPEGHIFGATKEAYPWTFGRKDFPYYDVHCAVFFSLMPKELAWPVLDMEYGDKGGYQSEQRWIIYKDPQKRAAELSDAATT